VLKDSHQKAIQSARRASKCTLDSSVKVQEVESRTCQGAPESILKRRRREESLGRLRKFEKLRKYSEKSAQESYLFQVPKLRRNSENLHAERKCVPSSRLIFIAKAHER
jgi:hypothetical protein